MSEQTELHAHITFTLDMAEDAEEFIRQLIREEIALHMERVVRYRGWGPARDAVPGFLRRGEVKAAATREETE